LNRPKFGLLIIGDEILSGRRADKHLAKVIELLESRGMSLSYARYLPDERATIIDELKRTFATQDIVFVTGGIGATPDDHTRQAAAAALGVDIELHPEARQLILERMAEMNQALTEKERDQRLRMGEFPKGANIIANPFNKIPGFQIGTHHFVPGFPVMAWPMLEAVLDAQYARLFQRGERAEKAMLVFQTAESTLTPLMEQIEARFPDMRVFSLPSVGDDSVQGARSRRHIELGVKGPVAQLDAAYAALRSGVLALEAEIDENL
jgi:molybdopterin-biosynthesis enzyme MoeA-like protein